MKAAEFAQIEFIKDKLRLGVDRKDILQEFTNIYKVGIKTFDNRLKIAREHIKQEVVAINERANDMVNDKAKESALKTISVAQRISRLAEIALNKENSNADAIKAIAELNKMDGSYAPTQVKSDNTTTIQWSEQRTYIDDTNGQADAGN